MQQRIVTVSNRLGLHARAAAKLVRLSSQFSSRITIERIDAKRIVDAKSIFSVLLLAATPGTKLLITTIGEDEQPALEAVARVIEDSLGEDDARQSEQ
jgi:phosphocarrier protein